MIFYVKRLFPSAAFLILPRPAKSNDQRPYMYLEILDTRLHWHSEFPAVPNVKLGSLSNPRTFLQSKLENWSFSAQIVVLGPSP